MKRTLGCFFVFTAICLISDAHESLECLKKQSNRINDNVMIGEDMGIGKVEITSSIKKTLTSVIEF